MSDTKIILKFHPVAWAKIGWIMCHSGTKEISGWGISAENDPLSVIDFQTVKQVCHAAETEMDDDDLATYMERMAKQGIAPNRCMRIWIHTHPFTTSRPSPSGTDENTLEKITGGNSDWSIMVIFSKKMANNCARLQFRPDILGKVPIQVDLEVEIDWSLIVNDEITAEWDKERERNIHEAPPVPVVVQQAHQPWWQENQYRGTSGRKGNQSAKIPRTFTDYKREYLKLKLPPNVSISIFAYMDLREAGMQPEDVESWFKEDKDAQAIVDAMDDFQDTDLEVIADKIQGKKGKRTWPIRAAGKKHKRHHKNRQN